jgi:murein L,D-transpeptidase YafK
MTAYFSRRTALGGLAILLLPSAWGKPSYTVAQRVAQFGPAVAKRLHGAVQNAGLTYPPQALAYVAFKNSKLLQVYGRRGDSQPWRFIKQYPIWAASGHSGPKLAEGDNQVPEGLYRAHFLNPNSQFHLSIRLNYPSAFDKKMAQTDGRKNLGGDIMIHGNAVSIGCLAMGDEAAEDLFVLAALAEKNSVEVLISPVDFRLKPKFETPAKPTWLPALYANIQTELKKFPLPGK